MITIHLYEVVYEEHATPTDDLILLYDTVGGGLFYVTMPRGWLFGALVKLLEGKRYKAMRSTKCG